MSEKIRRGLLAIPILLSIGVPYVMVGESMEPTRNRIKSVFGGDDAGVARPTLATGTGGPSPSGAAGQTWGEPPLIDLAQALRFDITPRWVLDHWPRVTTTRTHDGLEGLRVTLVTGTQPQDVAGSLTYYFNRSQQLQRIALRGVTGDGRHLVSLVTRQYRLQPEPTAGAEVYLAKWNGKPTSGLWMRRTPVVRAESPLARYEFVLELNRGGYNVQLSAELQQLLSGAHPTLSPPPPPAAKKRPAIRAVAPGRGVNTLYGGY